MKFISKPRVITAEQFILGQPLPEGVKFHESCANPDAQPGQITTPVEGSQPGAGCSLDGRYYVLATANQFLSVQNGDWIAPTSDGYFNVIKPDVMERNYQSVVDDPEAADNLTPAALALRSFMVELRNEFRGAAEQALRLGDREAEMKMVGYAEQIDALIVVPYSDYVPKERCPNCGWDGESAEWSGAGGDVGEDIKGSETGA